ncbi:MULTISPECIES: hypothetical protein [unclassified Streptomyces]|uniref:hypothetical protein n=1 Tax=unclassified Streptomyces TaxID=2593676 RepID=UPI00115F8D81|nr:MULTISPECIES: hypothetical protein [unclassified Streptomyces]
MNAGDVAIVGAAAAVFGALLGAGGAVMAATVTAQGQKNSQHAQWRRQIRREAYANLMTLTVDFSVALWALETQVKDYQAQRSSLSSRRRRLRAAQIQEKLDAATAAYHRVNSAHSVVDLEGPNDVIYPAGALMRAVREGMEAARARATRENENDFRSRRGIPPSEDISARRYLQQADDAAVLFKVAARDVLDS